MFICERCGKELQQGALICRSCGQRVTLQPEEPAKMKPTKKEKTQRQATELAEEIKEDVLDDVVGNPNEHGNTSDVSVGGFVGMEILLMIPIVNVIMLIVWICSKNATKKHFAVARIIVFIIGVVLGVVLYFVILHSFMGSISYLRYLM